MLQWQIAKKIADYKALQTKDAESLYFIEETGEIYRGEVPFTQACEFYSAAKARPAVGGLGKLYIDETTLAGSVWTGSAYKEIIKPVDTEVKAGSANLITSGAVATYVNSTVGDGIKKVVKTVEWVEDEAALKVTLQDATSSKVPLTKIATKLAYDGATGKITLKDANDTALSEVNIPLDNFVKSGTYDASSKSIILTMQNGSSVSIPAADLIDIYTGGATTSATVAVSNQNEITATVKVSAAAGNLLSVASDGLKVVADDTKADKVAAAHADELLVADATGNNKLSGVKVGGATIATAPNVTTVATEAAVKAIVDSLHITNYVEKASIVAETVDAANASTTKVVSEKALVNALSWKTVASA